VVNGSIFDVVVDVRRGSPTFGRWLGFEMSADRFHAAIRAGRFSRTASA
jgi:dTDP-4-dehydrorhamnose 3,5-epimerase